MIEYNLTKILYDFSSNPNTNVVEFDKTLIANTSMIIKSQSFKTASAILARGQKKSQIDNPLA